MSIVRKQGPGALTRRQQRRSRPDRGLTVHLRLSLRNVGQTKRGTRRTRNHALADIPDIPKQTDRESVLNRAFKGGVKLTPEQRYHLQDAGQRRVTERQRRKREAELR